MKNIYLALILLLLAGIATAQTTNINLTQELQHIDGFGAMSFPRWQTITTGDVDLAYGTGPGQLGLSIMRISVAPNQSDWSRELPYAQRAAELGAKVFATPWSPPGSMKTNGSTIKGEINPGSYGDYVGWLNQYISYMQTNNVPLYAISVQNEPDWLPDYESCGWSYQQMYDFVKNHGHNVNTRLIAAEALGFNKAFTDPILNDAAARANLDIVGTHLYGTSLNNFSYPLAVQHNKPIWMTEHYTTSDRDANLWPDALLVGEEIHNCMVNNFSAYVWWYLRRFYSFIHDGNAPSGQQPSASAGTVTKRGWVMSHFSRFIRPGYVRVSATANPASNVLVTAYKNPETGDAVIVAINLNGSSQTIQLNLDGSSISQLQRYTTTASKNVADDGAVAVSGGSVSVTLEANSITTFVGSSSSSLPDVSMIYPTQDTSVVIPADVYLEAEVSDPSAINTLQFFVNGEQVGATEYVAPYFTTLNITSAGTYEVTAVIADADGNQKTSAVRTITAHVPQSPYNNTAHPIPGTIQAEEFDLGGNGFAYLDNSPGSETGVSFRAEEDVDIENCTDAGGGYNIGWATAGEWLEYTVDVSKSATYNLNLRVACNGDNRIMHVEMDGLDITGPVAIPNTAGWQAWQTVTVSGIDLAVGEKIMRIVIGDVDYINLNYVSFEEMTVTGNNSAGGITFGCFPNPYSESIFIKKPGDFRYVITDLTGAILERGSGRDTQRVGKSLSSGIYFLTVTDASGTRSEKIIKQ